MALPTYSGLDIARMALRKIGVIDPVQSGDVEELNIALGVAALMFDFWATKQTIVGCSTRSVHNLVANQGTYTIGPSGDFNMEVPTTIERWSVITDGAATNPQELPRGLPISSEEWQRIGVKSSTGAYPSKLRFQNIIDANGRAACHVWPVPDTSTPDIVLYADIPQLVSLASNTNYRFRRGTMSAVVLNLAAWCLDEFDREPPAGLIERAAEAKAGMMRQGTQIRESGARRDFAMIGNRHRGYSGSIVTIED